MIFEIMHGVDEDDVESQCDLVTTTLLDCVKSGLAGKAQRFAHDCV